MGETIKTVSAGTCTLWTPWGPQDTAKAASPQLASIRRTIRHLKSTKLNSGKVRRDDALSKPECAYDP
jgi:hypothetical protein